MIRAYARVSTDGQSLDSQLDQLRAAGAVEIFSEKISGVKQDRAELARAIAALQPGDVLMVKCIDRLARSTLDLLAIVDKVAKAKAGFRSLQESWLDTTTPQGVMLLTVLGGIAQFERSLILSRTEDGKRRARERGVKFGPKPKLTPRQIIEARAKIEAGETFTGVAELFNVSRQTIMRAVGVQP